MKKLLCLAVLLSMSLFVGTACDDDDDDNNCNDSNANGLIQELVGEYAGEVVYTTTLTLDNTPVEASINFPLASYKITEASNCTARVKITWNEIFGDPQQEILYTLEATFKNFTRPGEVTQYEIDDWQLVIDNPEDILANEGAQNYSQDEADEGDIAGANFVYTRTRRATNITIEDESYASITFHERIVIHNTSKQ